jgi:hypothetical protein
MVDSTVSGPMPSPGIRVAVIGLGELIVKRLIMEECFYFNSVEPIHEKTSIH